MTKGTLLSLETIEKQAFKSCFSLTNIPHLPALKIVGMEAFADCRSLTEVNLGPSIISAARNSFDNCSSLKKLRCTYREGTILPWAATHVEITPETTHISNSAFAGCKRLRSVPTSPALQSIGDSSFWGCEALLDFDPQAAELGIGAFARSPQFLNMPSHARQDIYTWMGGQGEIPPKYISNLVIHETVEMIEPFLFQYHRRLETVKIQSKSIRIEEGAFYNCSSLQSVTFDADAEVIIGSSAFLGCQNLQTATMPTVVQAILKGTYDSSRINSSSRNTACLLPPPVLVHVHAFAKCPAPIVEKFKRYHILQWSWHWVAEMEWIQIRNRFASGKFGHQTALLSPTDLYFLCQTFSLKPAPPNDVICAIVAHLHRHDSVLKRFPHGVICTILEYI